MNITRKGVMTPIEGKQPQLGSQAPDFRLYDLNDQELTAQDLRGQTVLISVFPDIDTRVCAMQTRRFFELAKEIPDVKIVNVSNNTKESLENWCATNGIDVLMLRDTDRSFAKAYGLWMPEFNALARSTFILDPEGTIVYEEIVPEMTQEPDYDAVIAKAKELSA